MDADLTDVGLDALEALEAQDNEDTSNSEDNKETTETEESGGQESENAPETSGDDGNENDGEAEDSSDAEEADNTEDEGENSEEDKEDDSSKEDNPDEMSDEEFEKLAKKRGYAKGKTEEEQKAEDERADAMAKILAKPDEIEQDVWDNMPDENKAIYNALPYLVAEGKKGAIKVKTPDQLPDGFEFKDQKAMMKFQNDLQAQELKATQMSEAIARRNEREQEAETRRAEAEKIIGEINTLQKSGELPKPKAKAGTKEFDVDPAVLMINKVLGYRSMRAEQGVNLSVRDSLLLYKAEHPEEFEKKEARGDIERKNIAKKVAGNSKATSSAVNANEDNKAHYYRPGMSTEDVLDAVLNEMD